MNLEEFHTLLTCRDVDFYIENGMTIISEKNYSIFFNQVKEIPENLIFRNDGAVYLELIEELPISTIFENIGNVFIKEEVVEKLPKSYSGFRNIGGLEPENFQYKLSSIKTKFSEQFRLFLIESENELLKKIRDMENTELKNFQISFVDCCDECSVSFLPYTKIYQNYKNYKKNSYGDFYNFLYEQEKNLFEEGKKNKVKIGRFLKKILPEINDKEAEEITNLFKSYMNSDNYEFEIFTGEDIRLHYNKNCYDTRTQSVLDNSCYSWLTKKDKHITNKVNLYKQLEFFVKNPNIGVLVLREKNAPTVTFGRLKKDGTPDKRYGVFRELKKIKARALIWKCKNGENYLDSIYSTKASEEFIYKNYAKDKNYLSRINNSGKDDLEIDVPNDIKDIEVIPKYLDSLFYYKEENIIKGK